MERLGANQVLVCLLLAGLQALVGVAQGNKTLCVSALFSLHAGLSAMTLRMAVRTDRRGPSSDPSYDSGKLQLAIIAAGSAVVLLAVAALGGSLVHSWLAHQQQVPSLGSGAVAVGCAATMALLRARATGRRTQGAHPLLRQHREPLAAAALAALGVVGAVLLTRLWGAYVDSVVAVVAAGALALLAGRSLGRSTRGLLDESVPPPALEAIERLVGELDGQAVVRSIRGTRAGHRVSIAMVVELPASMLMGEASRLRERIVEAIERRHGHLDAVLVAFRPPVGARPLTDRSRGLESS